MQALEHALLEGQVMSTWNSFLRTDLCGSDPAAPTAVSDEASEAATAPRLVDTCLDTLSREQAVLQVAVQLARELESAREARRQMEEHAHKLLDRNRALQEQRSELRRSAAATASVEAAPDRSREGQAQGSKSKGLPTVPAAVAAPALRFGATRATVGSEDWNDALAAASNSGSAFLKDHPTVKLKATPGTSSGSASAFDLDMDTTASAKKRDAEAFDSISLGVLA